MQDLVEALSDPKGWQTPRKRDQAAYERDENGNFTGFEPTPPFEYHNGYLTVHFDTANYQQIKLAPIQEEALW